MREIKFRAWAEDDETGKMQMFYDVQCAYDTVSYEVTPHDQWSDFSQLLGDEDIKVMQFTGALDKNGKEIYESDIVSFRSKYLEMGDAGEGYRNIVEWHDYSKGWIPFTACVEGTISVIGNIYENPELLK